MINDLRYAIRMLLKSPGFTAVAVLTLSVGIGANTAMFSMLDAVLLKMLPVKDPGRLVVIAFTSPEYPNVSGTAFSYPMFRDLRDRSQVFAGMLAYSTLPLNLNANDRTERVSGQLVSGNFFSVLGVNPFLGRTFSDEDNRMPGAHPLAILSYNFWKRRLAADPSLVGKTIRLNSYPFTVVGVAPPDFFGVEVGKAPEVWVPMMMQAQMMPMPQLELMPGYSLLSDPGNRWLSIMARLNPGTAEQQARAATDLLFQRVNQEHVDSVFQQALNLFQRIQQMSQEQMKKLREVPSREMFERAIQERRLVTQAQRIQLLPGSKGLSELRRQFSEPLLILMTVVGLVLLVACANVANLLLARGAARQREMAVRLALGAGRIRLVRQLLTESVLLSGLGSMLGLIVAFWGVDLLSRFLPQELTAIALELQPDLRMLGFTLGVSLLTGILFGLAPAMQSTWPNLVPALKSEASAGRGTRRLDLRKVLVVSQVALSLLLLIGAGLFIRTLQKLNDQDLGFDAERVLLLSMDPSLNGYRNDQISTFYAGLLQRVETLPGVQSVSLASERLSGGGTDFSVEGYQPRPGEVMDIAISYVESRFFETMGMRLLAGRDFGPQDDEVAAKAVIVNQRVAREFFGSQNPIGKRIGLGSRHRVPNLEIIGVVRDARYFDLRQPPPHMAYLPFRQSYFGWEINMAKRTLLVRTTGEPTTLIAAVRREVRALDKDLPVYNIMTLIEQVNELLVQERLIATLSSFFGLLALLLAGVGLYGILSYVVVRRTNEIGIRMALGAQQRDVLWMVLKETLQLVLIGVAVGLAASLVASRLISSMLFGLTPTDPVTFLLAILLLVAVAALAGYLPARKASRVDPMEALRYE